MNIPSRLVLVAFFSACHVLALRGGEAGSAYAGKPYAGKVPALPGVVQAEWYDVAPNAEPDIAFHSNGKPRQTPWRVPADSVGLAGFGAGHVSVDGKPENPDQVYAGWTHVGQWWRYTVKVTEGATYRIGGHFASGSKDARLRFTFTPKSGGEAVDAGPFSIPTTAGRQPNVEVYHVWETLDNIGEVTLTAGDYVMKVEVVNQAGLNIDWIGFSPAR